MKKFLAIVIIFLCPIFFIKTGWSALVFTEIHYNPARSDSAWEWIELYNNGAATVDLNGWVLDDNNSQSLNESNLSGSIEAGQFGVLFNADALSSDEFQNGWANINNINLIAVDNWSRLSLGNSGDQLGLWNDFSQYNNDHQTHNHTVLGLNYDDSAPWPQDDGFASIYLRALDLDPADGASWSLSELGVDQAVNSEPLDLNGVQDVGSPGVGPAAVESPIAVTEPEPWMYLTMALLAGLTLRRCTYS